MQHEVIVASTHDHSLVFDVAGGPSLRNFRPLVALSTQQQQHQEQHRQASSSSAEASKTASFAVTQTATICAARDGNETTLLQVQAGKGLIGAWSFRKDLATYKYATPFRFVSLAISPSGRFLAAGAEDGQLFLWETASGRLLSTIAAHFRALTALVWTDDEAALVSGGADAALHVWSLASLASPPEASGGRSIGDRTPYCSLNDHTLPILDLHASSGRFPRLRIYSAAADNTIKVWDLSLPLAPLLHTLAVERSTGQLHSIAIEPSERFSYAACHDAPVTKRPAAAASVDKAEGSSVVRLALHPSDSNMTGETRWQTKHKISALRLSDHSLHLFVGTEAGTIEIIALPSLQTLRSLFLNSTGSSTAAPVLSLHSLVRPLDLQTMGRADGAAGKLLTCGLSPTLQTVLALPQPRAAHGQRLPVECVPMRMPAQVDASALIGLTARPATKLVHAAASTNGTVIGTSTRALQTENETLRNMLARAEAINIAICWWVSELCLEMSRQSCVTWLQIVR
ncbi:uncharacterized protein L969DRAFT_43023 [Mixia osmundae IAM 14324]|uniref:Pre-rRNA-processing protein IPI3 n=1 Tax=Mixia osmundae (strain CBS 9802 / IAM 14324 / JCM 22182 / KY 12970) TaxID=764103 RepID=G7DTC7_MIXOS|nr:uncharacterized protein L969DRAFT_43023 [Mixia osmundae IAM 14324]KEI42889.1 hypothetical protein L969DRAFT_43023 [Mixia osmundae IAM 14324]GAA93774.1 hypothetical protein E5Q_00420 [Mixia osmundae IAM 14324]